MNFIETLFLFFALISFILAFFFYLKRRGDRIANIILGSYLLLFSMNLTYNVLYWSNLLFDLKYINLFGYLVCIWVMYPPLIYLYLRRIVRAQKFTLRDFIHCIPLLIVFILYHRIFLLNAQDKLSILQSGRIGDYIYLVSYAVWGIASVMIIYAILALQLIKNANVINYNKRLWLKFVWGAYSLYVIAMIVYFVLSRLQLITVGHDYFIMFFIIFFISMVAYFGFMQPEIFNGLPIKNLIPFKKYQKTGLSEDLSVELKTRLIELMDKEKPYLNSDLRLNDLAEKLNLSRHHMSQIINEHFNSSFFFFVNRYRISEAKELLDSNKSLNINDIIFLSGFNNRVSFYKAFKIFTGMTPLDYKSSLKI